MAVSYLCALHFLLCVGTQTCVLVDASLPGGGETRGSASGRAFDRAAFDRDTQDVITAHMYKIYDKYSREHRQRDGNTVRSFRALPVSLNNRVLFQFNLTSVPESEVIVTATLHFLEPPRVRVRPAPWSCRRLRGAGPSCRPGPEVPGPGRLVLRGVSPNAASPLAMSGTRLASLPLPPLAHPHWPQRNVSVPVQQAQAMGLLMLTAELQVDSERLHHQHRPDSGSGSALPYLLVYTDDQAIGEPNSVAASLQHYGSFPGVEDPQKNLQNQNQRQNSRPRRHAVQHLQNNLLPDLLHTEPKNRELWRNTYFPLKSPRHKPDMHAHTHSHTHMPPTLFQTHLESPAEGAPPVGGGRGSQELKFDERTMKKARRRQWNEPRACSRRYLRLDFADIGWSEWVLAPKAFEAFYCAGTCRFPISKMVRPSNHATIQSIVRAVGIIPGVPEPCCVPDKMSALPVLYLDPQHNLVLKVYPGMSVDTCTCQ